MAITMRIGYEKDFIPERMHVGELAISKDTGLMRYCYGPNKIKLIATDEDIAEMRKMVSDFDLTVQQALADIGNLGQSQTNRINNAGQAQTQRVNTAGDTQVSRIQAEGTTQIQNVQATAAEISADREQIHTNRDNTARLQRTTAGAITRSAEGSFITLEDAADEMGFRRLEIPGMTEQRTTTGAQLFDEEKYPLKSGIWINKNSGMTSVDEGFKATPDFIPIKEYVGRIINLNKVPSGTNPGMAFYDVDKVYISGGNGNGNAITVPTNAEYMRFCVDVKADEIMINLGSTALPWEPYTGSKPSPSPEYPQELENVGVQREDGKFKVKVTACKNNLLDMTGAKGGMDAGITATVNPDGSYTSNGTVTTSPINIWFLGPYRPNPTYENMVMVLVPGKTYHIVDAALYSHEDGTTRVGTFFVDPQIYPEGYKVTGVRHPSSSVGTVLTNKVHHPRVILGDTDTGWEPYRGHTATITSDRPLTKWDKLTCRDGVWGWQGKSETAVYDGSEDEAWSLQSINANGLANFQIQPNHKLINADADNLCSHFIRQTEWIANVVTPGFFISNIAGQRILYIRIPSTTAATVDELKTWLGEHMITLQYQTIAETWVPLSAKEQAAMNALCTYAGTTHIWTDDPLQPVISLDYTMDTEGYIRSVMGGLRFTINPDDMGLDIIY